MPKRVDHPIILGIVGDSASGKTTLSAGVAQILGAEHCTVICTDDYHRYSRAERAAAGLSALDPRANYLDILEQHLRLLRSGEPILKPVYDHRHGTFESTQYVKPKEFVIAEGLLGFATRAMRECYDVKIYLDPEEELRVNWKIHRDTTKRGYTLEEVLAQVQRRESPSQAFIHPQRTFADIVIRFQRPNGANGSMISNLVIQRMPALSMNMKLDWGAIPGANTYYIYRDTNPLFTPAPGNLVGTTPTNQFIDVNATNQPQRFYRLAWP